MATEIKVPTLGESVTEATIAKWFKQPGEAVTADEPLVELETDKVTVEVPAPASGVLEAIVVKDGETVEVGALLGMLAEGAGAAARAAAPAAAPTAAPAPTAKPAVTEATVPPAPSAARLMTESGVS
ncbi:dihydrolipoamide acetyltransferase, partial [Mycobacterium tuberculosis]|nr:dihydrolipoamide acetyltransferase [Mycobacterium tuberculosis]